MILREVIRNKIVDNDDKTVGFTTLEYFSWDTIEELRRFVEFQERLRQWQS